TRSKRDWSSDVCSSDLYFFSPDPGSKKISSIGGNIATDAGGMSSLKYGTTKRSVIGLKVVLADGSLIELGGKTFKNNVPYDLTRSEERRVGKVRRYRLV